MPFKFFLRLYTRLAGLILLVLVICVGLFWGVNGVRQQAWQEQFAQPLMQWLATIPPSERNYEWLNDWLRLTSVSSKEHTFSPVIQERLDYGQVVSMDSSLGPRLLIRDQNGQTLQLQVSSVYRDVARALALLSQWHLNMRLPAERAELMDQLAESLNIDFSFLESSEELPDEAVLDEVSDRGYALFRPAGSGESEAVLLRLTDGTLVKMDIASDFNLWDWPVLLLLLIVAGGVLALALLLLLQDVDHNLRAVESVALRMARGEMDARVEPGDGKLVSRLAAAFNSLAEQIQRLVAVQREMIHAVSHELRTPVARIRFGVQMIEASQEPEQLQKQLDGIDGDIQELDELIDEILTYARLEQGGPVFSLQEASVVELVEQVVREQQLIRPNITISADIPESSRSWALSDLEPRYIHRAMQNLVGNAARYAQSEVRVICQLDEHNCRVDVEDDGPGIPEGDWEKVFTAFARLDDSRTRESGGYGLGLSIVRRILYWHGGQAFVARSAALGGARFSLVWPRRKEDSQDPV